MTVVREKEQRGSTVLSSGRHTDQVVSGAVFERIEIAKVNATVVEGRRRALAHWTSIGSWRVGGGPAPPILGSSCAA
jgi:hypothetical protein